MRPKDLEFGLLGERLGHSFSPAIHRQLAGYDYQLVELPPEEVEPFLRTGRFRGLNVTIPYKKTVMACCDALSPAAERIGSVNTLLRRPDGTLYGDNTDYDGFRYLLQAAGAQVRGKKALVLGSGGASLTVHAVLADLGARETVGISRNGPNNYENLDRHADAQLIVNATPVGMYPNARVSPVDLEQFPNCEGVFDLIYNPARTQLLLDAERRGLLCSNGLGMLVAQAKAAAERFLGRAIPDSRVEEITRQMERQTQNLLLIGMPGCGKTTVGQLLAERLGPAPGRRRPAGGGRGRLLHSGPLCPGGRGGLPGPGASGPVPAVQAVRTDHRLWRRHCHPPGELGPHAPEFHGDLSPPGSGPAPHQWTPRISGHPCGGAVPQAGPAL